MIPTTPRSPNWLEFDLHGYVTMRVDGRAPTAPQMAEMFRAFRTSGLGRADLTVTSVREALDAPSFLEDELEYTDDAVWLPRSEVQVVADGSGFRVHGRRELLTTVLPLVDRVAVGRGAAMIHAATVEYRGHGLALPAAGGTGKTSTIAKLTRCPGFAFMGDDWAFLDREATLLGYAKPMFIKPHHRPLYPHLFTGTRKPLVPSSLSRPVARLTTLVHPLVTRYPRLAGLSRRWSPEHRMVRPEQAMPGGLISTRAPLAAVMCVERHAGPVPVLEERDTDWMVSRLVGNFHIEMASQSRHLVTALGASGLVPLERTFAEKAEVLRAAVRGRPTFLLKVPRAFSADRASGHIVEHVHALVDRLGLGDLPAPAPEAAARLSEVAL